MKALKEIFLSQLKIFARERITLLITIILPLLLGIFLGLVFSRAETQALRIALVDEDQSDIMGLAIDGILQNSKNTRLQMGESTREEALSNLKEGEIDGVLLFPGGSALSMMNTKESKVTVFYDPARVQSAITRVVLGNLVSEINMQVGKTRKTFILEEQVIGEKEMPLGSFFFPNFLAISLLWLSLFATALPLVKQREGSALIQMKVTPLSPVIFMLATTLNRLFIGLVQSTLFVAAGLIFLDSSVLENLPLFILAVLLGNFTFIAMGYMIASISKSVQGADAVAQLFNFGMMFLSGVFFTKEMLPDFIYKISYVIPLTYLADLYRQLMFGYEALFPLWLDFAVLGGCTLLFTGVSLRFFRLFSR